MPRPSSLSLPLTSTPPRLKPPAGLSEKARATFVHIVASCKPGHFQPQDEPLLVEYCRAAALAAEADGALAAEGAVVETDKGSRLNPWITVQEKAQRAMNSLSHRLKLSPQGRSPTNPKRQPALSVYETMQLEEGDDDAVSS